MIKHKLEENTIIIAGSQPGCDPVMTAGSLWTVEDVAIYLKLQPETIRSMARRGELPAIKLGKVWRFDMAAIHAMCQTNNLFA